MTGIKRLALLLIGVVTFPAPSALAAGDWLRNEAEDELRSMIARGNEQKTSFYVEWSINDLRARFGMHSEEHSRELAALLRDQGYRVVVHEVSDGAGWGSWRARNDRILENFFPLP